MTNTVRVKVWDWPLRLFHWALVTTVTGAIVSGEIGGPWADWHGRFGLMVLGLLIFRLIWGFVGTTYSRFADFFPTPFRILAYFRGFWQGHGHNPCGALAIFALLIVLLIQVSTGLFANDDIAFEGPLASLIDKSLSDKLTGWHTRVFWGLAILIGLHLASVGFHAWVKKHDLIGPMWTGNKRLPGRVAEGAESSAINSGGLLASTLLAIGLVLTVANGGLPERFIRAIDMTTTSLEVEEPEPAVL
ncbi:MAG: cytochrome b/b6 domain-containing protein [Methylococcaceae bacterium]